MRPLLLSLMLLVSAGFGGASARAQVDGIWLDNPLAAWNSPMMTVLTAPQPASPLSEDSLCIRLHRPPETPADAAVSAAGWTLFNSYQAGWGVTLVYGLAGHDSMCRPLSYQEFVFLDGAFIGTIAPQPMNARTDGAELQTRISPGGDGLSAQFARYSDADPLCCPSSTATVDYRIERTPDGPVLVPISTITTPSTP